MAKRAPIREGIVVVGTAQYCLGSVASHATIEQSFIDCIRKGVPGGAEIGKEKFRVGQPTDFVNAYIGAQEHEEHSIEPVRVMDWSIAPFVVTAGVFGLGL